MEHNKKRCDCSEISNLMICDEEIQTSSDDIEIIMDTSDIQLTDKLLIIREHKNETRVYKVSLKELLSDLMPAYLNQFIKNLPECDPEDGSPWVSGGVIMQGSIPHHCQ